MIADLGSRSLAALTTMFLTVIAVSATWAFVFVANLRARERTANRELEAERRSDLGIPPTSGTRGPR